MATVRREIRIARPPADVWSLIRDPMTIADWFPGVVSCTLEGSIRTVTSGSGLSLREEIITIDDDLRRFQYRIDSPMMPHHLGVIDVIDDRGDSLVIYSTDIEPDPMAPVFSGATGEALDRIKLQLERPGTEG